MAYYLDGTKLEDGQTVVVKIVEPDSTIWVLIKKIVARIKRCLHL